MDLSILFKCYKLSPPNPLSGMHHSTNLGVGKHAAIFRLIFLVGSRLRLGLFRGFHEPGLHQNCLHLPN